MRLILVIISSLFLFSGCSLWNKYVLKRGVEESTVSEREAMVSSSGTVAGKSIDRGVGVVDQDTEQSTTIIQQNTLRPQKNEILIKYRNKSSEVILSLDPRDNNVQIDVSKSGSTGESLDDYASVETPSSQDENASSSPSESDFLVQAQNSFYAGSYEKALQQVNSSINQKPTARAYALKGSVYYMLGNLSLARKNWTNSLRLNNSIQGVRQMLNKIGY